MSEPVTQSASIRDSMSRIGPQTRLECGICWWVYDPGEGDPVWQVPPGTPFSQLPGHWRCPVCDGPKEKFLVLNDDR